MNALKLLEKYCGDNKKLKYYLVTHSKNVAKKALEVAEKVKHLKPDLKFIKEAAMLHDIGMVKTNLPHFGLKSKYPYICHCVLGRGILEKEGLPKHALVAERHIGLFKEEIIKKKFPLPHRDMVPITIEEEIISFADLFYSKVPEYLHKEKSIEYLRKIISKYGKKKQELFEKLVKAFY